GLNTAASLPCVPFLAPLLRAARAVAAAFVPARAGAGIARPVLLLIRARLPPRTSSGQRRPLRHQVLDQICDVLVLQVLAAFQFAPVRHPKCRPPNDGGCTQALVADQCEIGRVYQWSNRAFGPVTHEAVRPKKL